MKRVLIIPHDLNHLGGGSSVAAWTLQALAGRYEVSILSWQLADLEVTNRYFGTRLKQSDFRFFTIDPRLRRAVSSLPVSLAHLKSQILYRKARQLNEVERFDVVFGVTNEIDVGVAALQYIHYPWAHWPRPKADLRWYHVPPFVHVYRRGAALLSGYDPRRVARNLTAANSDWTASVFEQCYGVRPRTIYPPVPGGFPDVPSERRARGFTCLGRISPEKKLVDVIRILAGVRGRGHDVSLQIIGHVDFPAYMKQIAAAAAPHRSWISFHHDLPREEMAGLVTRNRYGIHGMKDEHFGIGPAELQRAGCITFVPNSGGSPEVVGGDERVIYRSIDDGIEKIDRLLRDPDLEAELRRDVERRRLRFTERRFMEEILALVDSFEPSFPAPKRGPNSKA